MSHLQCRHAVSVSSGASSGGRSAVDRHVVGGSSGRSIGRRAAEWSSGIIRGSRGSRDSRGGGGGRAITNAAATTAAALPAASSAANAAASSAAAISYCGAAATSCCGAAANSCCGAAASSAAATSCRGAAASSAAGTGMLRLVARLRKEPRRIGRRASALRCCAVDAALLGLALALGGVLLRFRHPASPHCDGRRGPAGEMLKAEPKGAKSCKKPSEMLL